MGGRQRPLFLALTPLPHSTPLPPLPPLFTHGFFSNPAFRPAPTAPPLVLVLGPSYHPLDLPSWANILGARDPAVLGPCPLPPSHPQLQLRQDRPLSPPWALAEQKPGLQGPQPSPARNGWLGSAPRRGLWLDRGPSLSGKPAPCGDVKEDGNHTEDPPQGPGSWPGDPQPVRV